ncbi:transposase [Bacteroidia bacterium]|nr:transposase [Bacteroidia bacterium]
MSSTFKILFYVRKNYVSKTGKAGIMIRITLNGELCQFSSKLEIEPELWDTKGSKAAGKSMEAARLNALLENLRSSLMNHYRAIEKEDVMVSPEKIRNAFLGIKTREETLLGVFAQYNVNLKRLEGISKSKTTIEKYDRAYRRLESFMQARCNIKDIALREINYQFVTNFENYLRSDCGCGENTTAKFMQYFRTIILTAKNNGWITADPFHNYKITFKKVDRGYLSDEELQKLMQKSFSIERLEHVKDIFIFCCFTGLAFVDVMGLSKENIRTSFDDNLWIMTKRHKTNVKVTVPLLKVPLMILEKYKGKLPKEALLPTMSNQKMNAYLKEIGTLCEIDKNLTTHLARHTFATTTTLSKGVPIETVSKMLGHTKLQTTQIYARITDNKISNDMNKLAGKLNGIENMYESN